MAIDPMQGDKLPIDDSTELAQATREERIERLRARFDEIRISEFNMTGAQFRIYCKFMLAPNMSSPTTLALTENEIAMLEKMIAVRDFLATHICSLPSTPRY
ncbi:MAG TPA: hypothetical protein VLB83_03750 [Candidatus Paceibacterota bacterium]|nr:hypothetical protein [Candidatus Paceibacterota bacterium]